jgi:hypothetical protein
MAPIRGMRGPARKPASLQRLAAFLAVGFLGGLGLGYMLMGTTHAIIQSRGTAHYGQLDGAAQEQQGQQQQQQHAANAGGATAAAATATAAAAAGGSAPPKDSIHTLCTGNGSPYQNYQLRIAYATYKLIQKMPGGERHVAFTRILHRTKPDHPGIMAEIETFRADPLQPACDDWCEYPVSDRANAVRQFFEAAENDPSMIKGDWILMIESDYVFMKPLQMPDAEAQKQFRGFAYPFDYIKPANFPGPMAKLYDGPVADIPGTGPAPYLMRVEDWKRVTPDWEKLTAKVEADPDLVKTLGWVREMYAFSVALAMNKISTELKPTGQTHFIAQLPIDESLGNAQAFHYTQCTIWKTIEGDQDVWKYDKRFHTSLEDSLRVPPIETPPEYQPDKWKTIEGKPISASLHHAVEAMVAQMNRGIATLPALQNLR